MSTESSLTAVKMEKTRREHSKLQSSGAINESVQKENMVNIRTSSNRQDYLVFLL